MAKVKLKSVRGAMKRFRQTKSGFKCRRANRNHILTKKSAKRKMHLRKSAFVHESDMPAVAKMLLAK